MEEDLDIRYESLNIQIDELQEKALKSVDEIEEKLLEKISQTLEPSAKRTRYNSSSRNKKSVVNIFKNFPFKSFTGIDKLKIGRLRDENKGGKVDLDETLEVSSNDGYDDDDDDNDSDHYGYGDYGYNDPFGDWFSDDEDDDHHVHDVCSIA
jgi:hypothetical protein